MKIERPLAWLYSIKPLPLLISNLCFFGFIALAHGGYALVTAFVEEPGAPQPVPIWIAATSAAVSSVCALAGLAALLKSPVALRVLMLQAVVLLAYGAWMLWFSLDIVIHGVPKDTAFAWNPMIFALVVTYPPFLWLRLHPGLVAARPGLRLLPFVFMLASFVISGFAMWRMIQMFTAPPPGMGP
jgi:hypothetical protein